MAVTRFRPHTDNNYSRPTALRPLRTGHLIRYDPLDRWLGAAEMELSTWPLATLPHDKAMVEVFATVIGGVIPSVHRLCMVAIDEDAGETPQIIHLARFVGSNADADAPLWTRRLPLRKNVRFQQPREFTAKLVAGMTDIDIPVEQATSPQMLSWARDTAADFPSSIHWHKLSTALTCPIRHPARLMIKALTSLVGNLGTAKTPSRRQRSAPARAGVNDESGESSNEEDEDEDEEDEEDEDSDGPIWTPPTLDDLSPEQSDNQPEYDEASQKVLLLEQQIQTANSRREEVLKNLQRLSPDYKHKRLAIGAGDLVEERRVEEIISMDIDQPPFIDHTQSQDKPRNDLFSQKLPHASKPAEELAKWICSNQRPVKGVPASAPDWNVDLRDARGHQALMTLAPPGRHGRTRDTRTRHRRRFLSILRILVIPGAYAARIRKLGVVVENQSLSEVDFRFPPINDEDQLIRALGIRGLSTAVADDCWQFCYRFLQDESRDTHSRYRREDLLDLLSQADAEVARNGKPPSIGDDIAMPYSCFP
ncbi:hypothetical protein C8R43DRAFT_1127001 [Mycena crocata]|nr:hypothetical protein C8R43DRAFT_1127001 [Mycena crocata]